MIEKPRRGQLGGNAEAIRLFIEGQGIEEVTLIENYEGGTMTIALAAHLQKKNPNVTCE